MTSGIWWIVWGLVLFSWIAYLWLREADWWSLALGGFSGLALATWAIEITGNKIPDSWRR